jgi:ribosomal protein L32E
VDDGEPGAIGRRQITTHAFFSLRARTTRNQVGRTKHSARPKEGIADARHVAQRAIVVQHEVVREGSDFRFQFPSTPPQTFGDQTYRSTSFIYDDERAAREAPQREAGQTRALLRASGVTPPVRWKSARLARVADPNGLREVIIFYMENADLDPAADLGENGYASLSSAEAARLLKRLRQLSVRSQASPAAR